MKRLKIRAQTYFPEGGLGYIVDFRNEIIFTVRNKNFTNLLNFFCFEILKLPKLFGVKNVF